MQPSSAPPVTKKEIFGWAMFDFANSSYTTVVITVVYSAFFVGYIVPPGSGLRDSYWSIAIILSTLLALVLSPVAGAICDYSGRKKRYLLFTTLTCAAATAALALVGPGGIWPAIALIVISNAAFMLSESFCGSFLPDLSTPETMGKISGLGWGIGYLGGLASVLIAIKVVIRSPESDVARYVAENQQAMVAIGAFFLLAALPTFLLVKNRSRPAPGYENAGPSMLIRAGVREFGQTVATAKQNRILFQFLGAFMIYMAGLDAIVKFVGIYAREEVHLTALELGTLFLVLQLSAAGGALGFGWLEGRIGPKRTVLLTLMWWILGVLGIYFLDALAGVAGSDPKRVFYGLALMAGAGIGATQASSRTVVGLLSPPDKSAQMFGFWGMFSRLGTILGTSFGFISDGFNSRRTAILVVVGFFVVGALLLSRVDIERGVREAQAAPVMIRADHLTRSFDGSPAIEDLSFEVPEGSLCALLGPNGAGKTTTMRVLLGLLSPDHGGGQVAGISIPAEEGEAALLRSRTGLLTETPGFYDRLSGRENLELFGRLYGLDDRALGSRIDHWLRRLALWEPRDRPFGTWSKGMKQRLALIRAVLHEPAVLFLDEPTSGLDPAGAREVREIIAGFRGEGRTILLCTHNLTEAAELADLVGILRRRMIMFGPPGGTTPEPDQVDLRLRIKDPALDTPRLRRELDRLGADVVSIKPVAPSLEEVYLRALAEPGQ